MKTLYKPFSYYPAKQPMPPTLISWCHIPLYSPQWVKSRPRLSAASFALCTASSSSSLQMWCFRSSQKAIPPLGFTAHSRRGTVHLLEDLAFMLLVILPTHKMRPISGLFITLLPKHFKREKQCRVHDFHAKPQPARLLAAANTSYSCWWWHRTSSPALMLCYVSLSRSSVGDSLPACGNSWNCFFRLTLQGLWRMQEAEL